MPRNSDRQGFLLRDNELMGKNLHTGAQKGYVRGWSDKYLKRAYWIVRASLRYFYILATEQSSRMDALS